MPNPTPTNAKEAATEYDTHEDGSKHVRGHHAIDPKGHLVLLHPGANLEEGWRWATGADHVEKSQLERDRKDREASELVSEHE